MFKGRADMHSHFSSVYTKGQIWTTWTPCLTIQGLFWGAANCLLKELHHLHSHQQHMIAPNPPSPHQHLSFLNSRHPSGYEVVFHCGFDLMPWITPDAKDLFTCSLDTCIIITGEKAYSSVSPVLLGYLSFLLLRNKSSCYILNESLIIYIFPLFGGLPFHSLKVLLAA